MTVTEDYDVVVVGGGAGGFGAAVGAAQAGARTLLLESAGFLGGAATLKCVQTYCGLFTISDEPRPAVLGASAQVIAKLRELGGVRGPVKFRGTFMLLDSEAVRQFRHARHGGLRERRHDGRRDEIGLSWSRGILRVLARSLINYHRPAASKALGPCQV